MSHELSVLRSGESQQKYSVTCVLSLISLMQNIFITCCSCLEGFTIELCAGLVDKAKTLPQIVAEEIHEEVGYDVPVEAIHKVSTAVAASGNNGADSHQFYAEVCTHVYCILN